jgi:DNA-binding MarR family transcriptional regulator
MPETSETPNRSTRPLPCACNALRRGGRALSRLYDEALAETGLKVTQYSLLAALSRSGPAPLTALADELVMDRSTLSRNLLPLERAGLVALEPGRDRRTRCAHLPEDGRRRLAEARPSWLAVQERVTERFGRDRLKSLIAELTAIVDLTHGSTVSSLPSARPASADHSPVIPSLSRDLEGRVSPRKPRPPITGVVLSETPATSIRSLPRDPSASSG